MLTHEENHLSCYFLKMIIRFSFYSFILNFIIISFSILIVYFLNVYDHVHACDKNSMFHISLIGDSFMLHSVCLISSIVTPPL